MNSIPKIVFSATMHDSIWDETTFVNGDLATAIAELKQQQTDGYLLAHGGARLVRSLCRTGLIDEVRLLVHPVVLGSGERIFPEPMELTRSPPRRSAAVPSATSAVERSQRAPPD